jgi:hypothetical protein
MKQTTLQTRQVYFQHQRDTKRHQLQYGDVTPAHYNRPIVTYPLEFPMNKAGFLGRVWYYFRIGYSTYLSFLLGFVSTLVTVYYLAIKNMPSLLNVFPHFVPFSMVAVVVGVPLAVAIGWAHIKRVPAYSAEMDISVEANPYYYKLAPGWQKEVWFPVYLELLVQLRRLLESQNLLSEEDEARIKSLEYKMQKLVEGGMVGSPRRKM